MLACKLQRTAGRLLHLSAIYNSKLSAVSYASWGSPTHFARMKGRSFGWSATATVLKRAQLALFVLRNCWDCLETTGFNCNNGEHLCYLHQSGLAFLVAKSNQS